MLSVYRAGATGFRVVWLESSLMRGGVMGGVSGGSDDYRSK